jgi:hypothetical protein
LIDVESSVSKHVHLLSRGMMPGMLHCIALFVDLFQLIFMHVRIICSFPLSPLLVLRVMQTICYVLYALPEKQKLETGKLHFDM